MNLLPQVEDQCQYIVGNTPEVFRESPLLPDVEILVLAVFAGGRADLVGDLWAACPKVRWVHSLAAGVDTLVPVLAALPRASEIPVTNAKGAFSRSLAEYSLAAMLHFNKQIPRLQKNREDKKWEKFIMNELHGQTVGFVGFGDIAKATARLCKAFGMRVLALRASRGLTDGGLADETLYTGGEADQRLELFARADHVVCSLPGTPATRHFCGAAEFAAMKPTATFISIGRGVVVDEAALAAVLREERIAGAALDVFAVEPLPAESELWGAPRTLISSHNADFTKTYIQDSWEVFLKRLREFLDPGFSGFADTVDLNKGY